MQVAGGEVVLDGGEGVSRWECIVSVATCCTD